MLFLGYGLWLWKSAQDLLDHAAASAIKRLSIASLMVPAFALLGIFGMFNQIQQLDQSVDTGERLRFEASFRNAETEKRFYGSLESTESPWAGYYQSESKNGLLLTLFLNSDNQFQLSGAHSFKLVGTLEPVGMDKLEGKADSRGVTSYDLHIDILNRDTVEVTATDNTSKQVTITRLKRQQPPRFPLVYAKKTEVEFIGVFSRKFREMDREFGIETIWLWRSKNEIWGRHLRAIFVGEKLNDVIDVSNFDLHCAASCDGTAVKIKDKLGDFVLKQESKDLWTLEDAYNRHEAKIQLHRGYYIPEIPYDLAPLNTKQDNQKWLDAVSYVHTFTWRAPKNPILFSD